MNTFNFIKARVNAGEHIELKKGVHAIASNAEKLKGNFLLCNGFVVHTDNGHYEPIENAAEWAEFKFWCLS